MRVFIQISGLRERIDFQMKPSDNIRNVKTKIAEDRAIPVRHQILWPRFGSRDLRDGLRDDIKLSQIDDGSDNPLGLRTVDEPNPKRTKKEVKDLQLILHGKDCKINVKTFAGSEFSIDCNDFVADLKVSAVKDRIYSEKGYPTAMQKLYLGDENMSQLRDDEHISSPQICKTVFEDGLILRVFGKVPVRNIERGAENKDFYSVIDAMDKIAKIKQQISDQHKCGMPYLLYIDGNKAIQYLEDDKRLCDYDLRGLPSFGLMMKTTKLQIFVKQLTGKTSSIECHAGELIAEFQDKVMKITGVPSSLIKLCFGRQTLATDKFLQDYGIKHKDVVHLVVNLTGD